MFKTLTALLTLLASPTLADAGVRASDTILDNSGLRDLLSGQVIEFFDGSKSTYQANGRYGYTYTDDGPVWAGDYVLGPGGEVCVAFDNGSSRCDTFVMDGARAVLVTNDGVRFPVRNITVAAP